MSDHEDCMEEDGRTFVMSSSAHEEPLESPSKKSSGLALNFAKISSDDDNEECGIQEQETLIVFELPDGSLGESYVSPKSH
jgi:hypothetical protein